LPVVLAVACAGEAALGEVDDDQLLHAELEDCAGGMTQRDGVEDAFLADLEAGHLARLVLVHDRVVGLVQEEEVAEMEDAGLGLGEVEVLRIPQGVRPTMVEEGALAGPLHRHDVRVARRRLGRGLQVLGVDLVGDAVVQDVLAVGVLAHETRAGEGESRPHLREIHQNIVRGTARALALGLDVGQLFELGIGVDDLDLIHDPVAAGEDAGALGGSG